MTEPPSAQLLASAPAVHPRLVRAFAALDRAGISWALLRGAAQLAQPDGDVDLLVAPGSTPAALAAVGAVGFLRVPCRGRRPHAFAYAADVDGWVKLDLVDQVALGQWHELRTQLAGQVLERRQVRDGVWRLSCADEAWLSVLHQVLDKQRPEAAAELAARLSPDDALARALPPAVVRVLLDGLAGSPGSGDLTTLPTRVRAAWPGGGTASVAQLRVRAARRSHSGRRWPIGAGAAVAVLGPDGAGKSTLTSGLRDAFPVQTWSVYMGLWRSGGAETVGRALPGGLSAVRVTRALRQGLRARWGVALGRLVLLDRSPYDAVVQRDDSLGGRLLLRVARAATPPPRVVVVLDAPAELMFARKGEHSVEQLEARRQEYLQLHRDLPHAVLIDATASPELVRGQTAAAIWDVLARPRA